MAAKALNYRTPLGVKFRFALWLIALKGHSGAYVIRSRKNGKVLYVGESHTGRLADTLRRHFNEWNDKTGRAHFVYDPAKVEVAIRRCTAKRASSVQDSLIARLHPRDNSQCKECEVPF